MIRYFDVIRRHGGDILASARMRQTRQYMQHGRVSVYRHSLCVALLCLRLARGLRLRVDEAALVRGALLHDYFLYDWHVPDTAHKWHGFTHPARALKNARRDFRIGRIEQDMIARHMFPLVPKPPRYRESVLLCAADKLCAAGETFAGLRARLRKSSKSY